MTKNWQFVVNMTASLVSFGVGLGIKFFLTPYIVGHLGREAYGFIGLASDILSYTGLVTVALNAMAGRFVAVKYLAGELDEANRYYSTVFFANMLMAVLVLLFSSVCVIWIERLVSIPPALVFDVKLLFGLLTVNNVLGLVTGIWGVSTFIKNRVDLSNVRGIVGGLMNVSLLVCLFAFFPPHIWYMGIAGMVMTGYAMLTNRGFCRLLTPELRVRLRDFEWSHVIELVKAGGWSVLTKLGVMLGTQFDLLLANVFIGASVMGQFSMTKGLPFLILALFQTVSGVFAPIFTLLYAEGKRDELHGEIQKSIRILSLFAAIPLTCLYFFGKEFYGLWLPTEDAGRLQMLTVLGTLALPYTLPLESLWNIFVMTNKLKYSSIFSLIDNFVVFGVVMTCMNVLDTAEARLLALASTRSLCGFVRGLFFLPMYGAHCLELPFRTFYWVIVRSAIYISLCFAGGFFLRQVYVPASWAGLVAAGISVVLICSLLGSVCILTRDDRAFIWQRILRRRK